MIFGTKKLQPRQEEMLDFDIIIFILVSTDIYVYSQSLSGQTFGRFEMEVFASKELPPCRRLSVGRKLWRDVMGGEVKHVSLT